MDRRQFIKNSSMVASVPLAMTAMGCSSTVAGQAAATQAVKTPSRMPGTLSWLEGAVPSYQPGTTFGYPWPEGELAKDTPLSLISAEGNPIPLQTWVTAYWPDGSVKWTAHAIPANAVTGEACKIIKSKPAAPQQGVSVSRQNGDIVVNTGVIRFTVPQSGSALISSLFRGSKEIGRNARLVGMRRDAPENGNQDEHFESRIISAEVEQQGPVRAVIKITGTNRTANGREWLPFTLRLYAFAGGETVQLTHSFIFDGNAESDFISGLGLRFEVVQRDALYNRHLRLVGENKGLWGEAVKGITGLRRDPGEAVRQAQIAGVATPPLSEWDERVSSRMHYIPVWNDITLTQINANGFEIRKRTKAGHGWIGSDQGHRASGVGYLGGVSGGVLFGMRDFWQLHPVQIDLRDTGHDVSTATIWFYSPEAPAMDVRFYHDGMGQDTYEKQLDALNITYEDYEPGFGDAHGIARTTEFTLAIMDSTPSRDDTIHMAQSIRHPARLIAAPEDYLNANVFGGLWSLPDSSTPALKKIEDRLAWQVEYYAGQVDQRHWYGFWNFGDIMHTYDADRHVWRYDIGGYAWDNSELSPDLWLWYSFLRTGDPTTFHLAERMTRHNRDVDIYHAGRFKGLGTRHNVQHWGCSAKQLRISTSSYRRFHYFLTGDERTGDVLSEVTDADKALGALNATRKVDSSNPIPNIAKMGGGTDWGSAAANWLTAWERTGDDKYRLRLENAMKVIGNHPQGFFAGAFGYDVEKQELVPYPEKEPGLSHLSSVFGLIEMSTELNQLLDVPEYKAAWLKYGRLYSAPAAEQEAALGKRMRGNSLTVAHSRLTAYVAVQENDPALAKRAWQEFAKEWGGEKTIETTGVYGPNVLNPVEEAAWVSTNDAAQWGLAAIQNIALVKSAL